MKLSNLHPRFYRLHDSIPVEWSRPSKDAAGCYWAGLGRFVFTTSPPSKYHPYTPFRNWLRSKGW